MPVSPTLRIFLCHASQDKPAVRELYQRLLAENWIDPWLDEEKLLPGQDWDLEIEKAVEAADVVIVCLSSHSVSKEGYVQRELKFVLDMALEKPDGTIFVIPLRLDECAVPRRVRAWQYVDYFPSQQRTRAYQRLIQSLKARHMQLAAHVRAEAENQAPAEPAPVSLDVEERVPITASGVQNSSVHSSPVSALSLLDMANSIIPILFFAQLAVFMFGESDDVGWIVLGVTAIVYALYLAMRRELIANRWARAFLTFFFVIHSVMIYAEYRGWSVVDTLKILNGMTALVVVVLHIANFKSPRTSIPYAAIFMAAYLAVYGIILLLNMAQIYPTLIQTPMTIAGMIAAVLLWLDRSGPTA